VARLLGIAKHDHIIVGKDVYAQSEGPGGASPSCL
jgi:hypothetical protein